MKQNLKLKARQARRMIQRAKALQRKANAITRQSERLEERGEVMRDNALLARHGVKLGQPIRFNGYDWVVGIKRVWHTRRVYPSLKRPSGGCAWGRKYECTLEKPAKYLKEYLAKESTSPFKLITPEQARAARQAVVYKATLGDTTYRIRKDIQSSTPIVYLEHKKYGTFRQTGRYETVEQAQAALVGIRMIT